MAGAHARRKKKAIRLGFAVAARLGVPAAKATLFPAVAAALGVAWPSPSVSGWTLVEQYARAQGLWEPAAQLVKAGAVIKKTAPAQWAPPKRVVRFAQKDNFLQTYEWRRLRMEVLKERGQRCECCGHSPTDGVTVLNVDHVKPRAKYPELALDKSNLQILCDACNHGKGNWDETDWRPTAPGTGTVQ